MKRKLLIIITIAAFGLTISCKNLTQGTSDRNDGYMERREFIKTCITASAGLAVTGKVFAFSKSSRIMGSNNLVNVAVIGLKSHGKSYWK